MFETTQATTPLTLTIHEAHQVLYEVEMLELTRDDVLRRCRRFWRMERVSQEKLEATQIPFGSRYFLSSIGVPQGERINCQLVRFDALSHDFPVVRFPGGVAVRRFAETSTRVIGFSTESSGHIVACGQEAVMTCSSSFGQFVCAWCFYRETVAAVYGENQDSMPLRHRGVVDRFRRLRAQVFELDSLHGIRAGFWSGLIAGAEAEAMEIYDSMD